jgi:hypothetical protein
LNLVSKLPDLRNGKPIGGRGRQPGSHPRFYRHRVPTHIKGPLIADVTAIPGVGCHLLEIHGFVTELSLPENKANAMAIVHIGGIVDEAQGLDGLALKSVPSIDGDSFGQWPEPKLVGNDNVLF